MTAYLASLRTSVNFLPRQRVLLRDRVLRLDQLVHGIAKPILARLRYAVDSWLFCLVVQDRNPYPAAIAVENRVFPEGVVFLDDAAVPRQAIVAGARIKDLRCAARRTRRRRSG